MDAESVECLLCVQPELSAAEEEDSWEGAAETGADEEGREQLDVPDPDLSQTPQLGDNQKDIICGVESCTQTHKTWSPSIYPCFGKEHLWFAGYEIKIQESIESYAGVVWPAAKALCYFLAENQDGFHMRDKKVLEIGSGTGLVSIVACLLGAHVIATDLPEVLGNLTFNLSRNTRGRCLHTPEVRELVWGQELDTTYPATTVFDYIFAADVVYYHTYLDKLLETMKHLCRSGTQLIWANKFRFKTDLEFLSNFNRTFQTELLAEFSELEVKIFKATFKAD